MLGSSYGESGPAPPAAGSRAASRNNRFFANCRGAMPSAEAAILRELPLSLTWRIVFVFCRWRKMKL